METLVGNNVGLIHLIFSIIAVVSGTWVLAIRKGTQIHRRVGYVYVVSMTILLVTAFMIYRLFQGFGIFHFFGLISVFSLVSGMYPIVTRPKNYIYTHFRFMYWSVIGLYGAFLAEIMVRLPALRIFNLEIGAARMFFNMVGVAVGIVMFFGVFYFRKKKGIWLKEFQNPEKQ